MHFEINLLTSTHTMSCIYKVIKAAQLLDRFITDDRCYMFLSCPMSFIIPLEHRAVIGEPELDAIFPQEIVPGFEQAMLSESNLFVDIFLSDIGGTGTMPYSFLQVHLSSRERCGLSPNVTSSK